MCGLYIARVRLICLKVDGNFLMSSSANQSVGKVSRNQQWASQTLTHAHYMVLPQYMRKIHYLMQNT